VPLWAWIALGVGGAAVVTAVVVAITSAWNRKVRRHVVQLLGKREEARSVRRAFEDLVAGLRDGGDEIRARFADDLEAVERHSLVEIAERARLIAEETNTIPMPGRLVPAAEALADAADILAEEAERVGEGVLGDEALEALASIDLARVGAIFEHAYALIGSVWDAYHVNDTAVYGGGLYI
jgi:hypothetical protein